MTDSNASWLETMSLATAYGTCLTGFRGNPTRPCLADGSFGDITNPCVQITCDARNEVNAAWPTTNAGETATGVCNADAGYVGSPTRSCGSMGGWGTITGSCTRTFCDF